MGLEFNKEALEAKGLSKFLRDMEAATQGNVKAQATLFPNTQALKSVLALAGEQADKFATDLEGIATAEGVVDEATAKVLDTFNKRMETLGSAVDTLKIRFGETVAGGEDFNKLLENLTKGVEEFSKWIAANQEIIMAYVTDTLKLAVELNGDMA